MNRKLYVGNLSYNTSESELHELFARAGEVESVKLVMDQATGRPRGFAFVEMRTDEGAQTAIRELNAREVGGRQLTVNEARPKTSSGDRGPGGDRGHGGGGGGGQRRRSGPRW